MSRQLRLTSLLAVGALLSATICVLASDPSGLVDGETVATPELVKAACTEGEVVYYTAQSDTDERAILQEFEKQFPCVHVSVISAVTGRLFEKIKTETQAGRPQADVLLMTDEALAQKLVDANQVRTWNPPAGSMYPVYNTDSIKADDAPKGLKDLLRPEFKGKLSASPISIGGTAWMQYAFLVDRFGEQFLTEFVAQQPRLFTSYNAVALSVSRGETVVGVTSALNEYPLRTSQNAPIKAVYAEEGTPWANYPMLLLKGAPHPNAGELLGNWYLSKKGQSSLVRVRGAYSVRADVASAPGNPKLSDVKPWNPGHSEIVRRYESLINEVSRTMR
jgi:iron(III) transport system substrate-binding protein